MPVKKTGFQSKHKIADRWEVDFYKVISQHDDNLLVFLVQNLSTGKERTQHQNMLYPIQYELRNDVPVSSCNIPNKGGSFMDDSDRVVTDEVNMPIYQGPQTYSHTKLLMKANIVMNDHFDIHSNFVPLIARPRWPGFLQVH